jgi:hypothetical protein
VFNSLRAITKCRCKRACSVFERVLLQKAPKPLHGVQVYDRHDVVRLGVSVCVGLVNNTNTPPHMCVTVTVSLTADLPK